SQRESPGEPGLSPLCARPPRAFRKHLLERRQREIQQRDERQLRGEQVLGRMRRQIERGELLVDGEQWAHLDVAALAKLALQIDEVPVDLLQRFLEATEKRRELGRIRLEP